MSVIVAIRYNNGVVIGADKQTTLYSQYKEVGCKLKQFKDSKIVMGHVGNADNNVPINFLEEIMDYKDIYRKVKVDAKYVYEKIVPTFTEIMNKKNRVSSKNGINQLDSTFIIASPNTICEITGSFGLYEYDKYHSIGCGMPSVNGYLNTQLKNKNSIDISKEDAMELIKNCIELACENDIYIGNGMDYFVLENTED